MKYTSYDSHQEQGLTLIELIVLIAMIAILAAVLFPVFASAREKARQATYTSNEKQLGLALLQYCQDYDEYEPNKQGALTSGTQAWSVGWAHRVYPYDKSTGAYTCPDDPTIPVGTGAVPISHIMNGNVIGFTIGASKAACGPRYRVTFSAL